MRDARCEIHLPARNEVDGADRHGGQVTPRHATLVALAVLLITWVVNTGHGTEPTSLLIRNVKIIDRQGEAEDVTVNLLIKDGLLDLVSTDEIPSADADLVLDAEGDVLIGNLVLKQPPSFLILDRDPREDFATLLDTEEHTTFAIHDGVIVTNNLEPPVPTVAESVEQQKTRWFAYTPPPMALPLDYSSGTKWNAWRRKAISGIVVGALALDRTRWLSQNAASRQQVELITEQPGGDLTAYDAGEIRALRVGIGGTLNFSKPWIYTIAGATNAFGKGFDRDDSDDFSFFDYRLDIPLGNGLSLAVGNQKEPISLERLTGMVYLPWQERSAVADALMPTRNFGAVLSGIVCGRRMTWAGGIFNDSLITGDSDGSATQVIGRVTGLPLLNDDESQLVHLGFGVRHTDAEQGLRFFTEPEFNQSPIFVDTGSFEAESATLYNLEASWRGGPFWLMGEYFRQDVDAPNLGDPVLGGFYISANWILTGEMRPYNKKSAIVDRVPVSQSVYQGSLGTWEAAIRWSSLDLTDAAIEGGEMDILSLGVNWWLTGYFSLGLNYRHIVLDRFDERGASDGVNVRMLLVLE
jgi:phosphate-selective porin OprO/OprP